MKNLKIDKKKKKAEIELSCDFYPERILRKAAGDFGRVFNVAIREREGRFVITLKPKLNKMEIEKPAYEFVNYVLAEVKNGMAKA